MVSTKTFLTINDVQRTLWRRFTSEYIMFLNISSRYHTTIIILMLLSCHTSSQNFNFYLQNTQPIHFPWCQRECSKKATKIITALPTHSMQEYDILILHVNLIHYIQILYTLSSSYKNYIIVELLPFFFWIPFKHHSSVRLYDNHLFAEIHSELFSQACPSLTDDACMAACFSGYQLHIIFVTGYSFATSISVI